MIYDISKDAVNSNLLDSVTGTGYGNVLTCANGTKQVNFHAFIKGTSGVCTATILLYGSNDDAILSSVANAAKILLNTFALSGTPATAGAVADTAQVPVNTTYKYYVANLSAISGTGAAVTVSEGAA